MVLFLPTLLNKTSKAKQSFNKFIENAPENHMFTKIAKTYKVLIDKNEIEYAQKVATDLINVSGL